MVVKPRSANMDDIAVILSFHFNESDSGRVDCSQTDPLSELESQDEEETKTRGVGATRGADEGGSRRINLLVVD